MTRGHFEMLVTGLRTREPPQERLAQICDELVKRRIINEDVFWNSVHHAEQALFAICSVINVTGHSGFESFCRHFSGSALALLACAERGLSEMREENYIKPLQGFLALCGQHPLSEHIALPPSFSPPEREAYIRVEMALHRTLFFKVNRPRLRLIDDQISSCWDSTLHEIVLAWIERNREVFKKALCPT